jgi:hypothetical protein
MTSKDLRAIIEETADEAGRVTREGLVAAAAQPDHPLHRDPKFLWGDDAKAAHQHRLEYAGRLIRTVYFTVRPMQRRQARAPYFVRDPRTTEKEPGHVPLESVEAASPNAAIVAADELRRVVGILKRTAAVVGVLDIEGLADEVNGLLSVAMRLQAQLAAPLVTAEAA